MHGESLLPPSGMISAPINMWAGLGHGTSPPSNAQPIPAQATLGIYTFLHAWNEYFWPLVSATKPAMYTLTVGLASMQTNFARMARSLKLTN